MVYFDQSYLPIPFLSPLQLWFQSSSWHPSLLLLSFYKSFILFLLTCVYTSVWEFGHGSSVWRGQMRLLEALLLKLQATVSHPTWLRELNFTKPPKHPKLLGQLSSSPPNDWMSSIRVLGLLMGTLVRVCLQCPGHFTIHYTNEKNGEASTAVCRNAGRK